MPLWKQNRAKPVIGLAGGIGSGKSAVARLLATLGCTVIDSDAAAHEVLQSAEIKAALRGWLGPAVFNPDGSVSRKAVAAKVFADPQNTDRLNGLIHPRVAELREQQMRVALADPAVRAVVWDTPLLFETGLNAACDAVIFIDASPEIRLRRVAQNRGWTAAEVAKREKLQFSLDKKAQLADYCINNSGDEASTLRRVRIILSQILALPV